MNSLILPLVTCPNYEIGQCTSMCECLGYGYLIKEENKGTGLLDGLGFTTKPLPEVGDFYPTTQIEDKESCLKVKSVVIMEAHKAMWEYKIEFFLQLPEGDYSEDDKVAIVELQ